MFFKSDKRKSALDKEGFVSCEWVVVDHVNCLVGFCHAKSKLGMNVFYPGDYPDEVVRLWETKYRAQPNGGFVVEGKNSKADAHEMFVVPADYLVRFVF